jgi:predicted permease
MQDIGLDARVLAFALVVAIVTAVTVGMMSAWVATRTDPMTVLRTGGRGGDDRGRTRARSSLIVIETAVSLVLLIAAGLLIGSFAELIRIDPGYDADGVVTVRFERIPEEYDAERMLQFDREVLERVRALPGVAGAASISVLPFAGQYNMPVTVQGRPDATEGAIQWRSISPGYFDALEIPIVRGRAFSAADAAGSAGVAIITESTAERYWPDGDALGQRILPAVFRGQIDPGRTVYPLEIVGIVPDLHDIRPDHPQLRRVYIPHTQTMLGDGLPDLVVRTSSPTAALATRIAAEIAIVEPALPAPAIRPLDELASATLSPQRFTMLLTTMFATLALALTVLGIVGVVSYTVGQRRREIGIRMALGGQRTDMVGLIVRQAMLPVGIGLIAGLALAAAVTRVLAGTLFGVSARDPMTFAVVAAVLAGVGLIASIAPGVRAARVAPVEALRLD